jgi:hypothetical protein
MTILVSLFEVPLGSYVATVKALREVQWMDLKKAAGMVRPAVPFAENKFETTVSNFILSAENFSSALGFFSELCKLGVHCEVDGETFKLVNRSTVPV